MKLTLLIPSLLVARTSALEKCNYAVVAPNLHSLATPIAKCMTVTGNSYNLARAEAPPTSEQAAAICAKCKDFVADVVALPPWPECTLNVGGSDQTLTSYFDKMIGGCQTPTATATATDAALSVTGTAAGSAATASNGTTEATATVTKSPSANASTPLPSPTSGAMFTAVTGIAMVVPVLADLLA